MRSSATITITCLFALSGLMPVMAEELSCPSVAASTTHIDWFKAPLAKPQLRQEEFDISERGCVMVVHGLNNKPSVMDRLIELINERGFDAERVTLLGHRDIDSLSDREIQPEEWPRQIHSAFCELKNRCGDRPIYNVSFSLGALSSVTFLNHFPEAYFDGLLLFAPAITITSWSSLLKLISPFRYIGLPLPSFMPENYQAHSLTTIWMYDSLFQLSDSIVHLRNKDIGNIPTRIIIHPDDFLVNADGLRNWIQDNQLEKWEIVNLQDNTKHWTNHLIVTPEFISGDDWKRIRAGIVEALNSND